MEVFQPPVWKEEKGSWKRSTRQLHQVGKDERRILESRLYFARMVWLKSDLQISQELDLDPSEFDVLSPLSRPAPKQPAA